jgi:hypothetical protein
VLCRDIHNNLTEIQALARLFDSQIHGRAEYFILDHEFFEMRIVAIENRLFFMPYQESYDVTALVQECCRTAALFFVHTTFWRWQK